MKEALDMELTRAFSSVENLQIIRIDLPKSYEDSIVATQVELQKTSMRKFEQTAELIRQNISVIISQAEQKIKVTNAEGLAEAYRLKQFAKVIIWVKIKARNIDQTIKTESQVYSTFKKDIQLDPKDLTNYLYLDSLMDQHGAKILVGLPSSIINFGGSNSPVNRNAAPTPPAKFMR